MQLMSRRLPRKTSVLRVAMGEGVVSAADAMLARVDRMLKPWPVLSQGFGLCLATLTARTDLAVAVGGSLARGTVDGFSDLDFAVLAGPGGDVGELTGWVAERVGSLGRRLAQFPATHVGLPNLIVTFFESGGVEGNGAVVKVDCMMLPCAAFGRLSGYSAVYDPGGILAGPDDGHEGEGPDWQDLDQKFTGWCWYAFTKIARGELMEAADALDVMRRDVVVANLRRREGLKLEGYRWLEDRLSAGDLAALGKTYPGGIDRTGLMVALAAQIDLYRSLRGPLEPASAALDRMAELIAREPLWQQVFKPFP